MKIRDLLMHTTLVTTRSEAKRLLAGGGVYINNKKVDADYDVTLGDAIDNKYIIVRTGKKNYFVIRLEDESEEYTHVSTS